MILPEFCCRLSDGRLSLFCPVSQVGMFRHILYLEERQHERPLPTILRSGLSDPPDHVRVMIAATNGGHGRAVRGGIRRVCGISSSPVRLLVPGGGWLSGQDSGTVYIRPENGLTTSDMAGVRLTADCRSALSSQPGPSFSVFFFGTSGRPVWWSRRPESRGPVSCHRTMRPARTALRRCGNR